MAGNRTYLELTVPVPEEAREAATVRLMELGCLGTIERSDAIVAFFEEPCDAAGLEQEMRSFLASSGTRLLPGAEIRHAVVPEQDWNRDWKAGFKPLDVGRRFTILPPWENAAPGRTNLIIDPGMAFGTGHHETTRSCLMLIEKFADPRPGKRFLDLGTGTGLLAIAAVKLGYEHVVAADNDPEAIEATERNLALNGIRNIQVHLGTISSINGPFDLIAANIISGVLVSIASDIAARLAPAGAVILSGILTGQEDEVAAAMNAAGLVLREQLIDGKWVSLLMSHAANP